MTQQKYDVAIVGTGPAGFMAALKLIELVPGIRIIMFEKGKLRSAQEAKQTREKYDAGEEVNVTEGWGGAGAFSDGKFNLDNSGKVGGQLVSGGYMLQELYQRLLHEACQIYIKFGGDADRLFGYNKDTIKDQIVAASGAEAMLLQQEMLDVERMHQIAHSRRMSLHTFPIQHLGTSNAHKIVENIREHLQQNGVEIITECRVTDFEQADDGWRVITENKGDFQATRLIVCPGRSGAQWFRNLCVEKGFELQNNGVDIGVRVETTQAIMDPLTRLFYESKIYYRGQNDDELRTFCMCPNGRVAIEAYRDTEIFCANGHTDPDHPSQNCNFSILQTQRFTKPFNDPLAYATMIAGMCTALSGGVIVQRLGDLLKGRRSTGHRIRQSFVTPTCTKDDGAIPGDIALAMPGRFVTGIVKFIEALNEMVPGLGNADTLLYAPEIKFNAVKVAANAQNGFEVRPGLHVAGDGTGYTRGLNGASIHGMAVAMKIAAMMS